MRKIFFCNQLENKGDFLHDCNTENLANAFCEGLCRSEDRLLQDEILKLMEDLIKNKD